MTPAKIATRFFCLTFFSSVQCLLPVINSNAVGYGWTTNGSGLARLAHILARRQPTSSPSATVELPTTESAPPVNIAVYYETLCPYCQAFITKQLYPLHQKFGSEIINATFIPFGNAREIAYGGRYEYVCQHGIQECIGNNVHVSYIFVILIKASTKYVRKFRHCCRHVCFDPTLPLIRQ